MSEPRLRGQEAEIRITVAGALSDAFTAVASFNDTMQLEASTQGFLGELTDRKDSIFNGFEFGGEMQVENQQWMAFQQTLKDKAQRKTPDVQINIVRTDFYANGDAPSRTYLDCSFGAMPTAIASRADFVKVSFAGQCSDVVDDLAGTP
jgi:hypothetical protein